MSQKEIEIWGKPLSSMTTPDLREIAKAIPGIEGVHGMKKGELIFALRQAKGIKTDPLRKGDESVKALKQKIKSIKAKRAEAIAAKDRKVAAISKRRISRLKKRTRNRAA